MKDFTLNDLVGGFAPDEGLTCKLLIAAWAGQRFFCEVLEDALSEAFDQMAVAAFLVVVEECFAGGTVDLNGFGAAHVARCS